MINQKFRLLLRNNILLGLAHTLRKRYLRFSKRSQNTLLRVCVLDVFDVRCDSRFSKFFQSDPGKRGKLIAIAQDFVDGTVSVYGRKVMLSDHKTARYHEHRNSKKTHLKDIRFHWEIYRGKFVFPVAVAYQITGKEAYATALSEYVLDWASYSPLCDESVPYNGMEAALKLINFSWIAVFLIDSPAYTENVRSILIEVLVRHADYIYRNYDITSYGLESNHGLSCAAGLMYAAALLPDYADSRKWLQFGMSVLSRGLTKQFSPDGVNFESSIQYHRYVTELLIFTLATLYATKTEVDSDFHLRISNSIKTLAALAHSNGCLPRIGDSDGGKFFYDLGTAAEFNSLAYVAWFEAGNNQRYFETLLLETTPNLKAMIPAEYQSTRAGDYLLCKKLNLSLIVAGHGIGTTGKGNHQHNDFLSFELYGRSPFIVDRWSFCYTGNPDLRNKDRQTTLHNCVAVDGRDIVPFLPGRLFEMLGKIQTEIVRVVDSEREWRAVLRHDGYRDLANGAQVHTRTFFLNKQTQELKVIDELTGFGEHVASLNFYIPQKYWQLTQVCDELRFENDKEKFVLTSSLSQPEVKEDFVSEIFLSREPAYCISFQREYQNSLVITTQIRYQEKVQVKQVEIERDSLVVGVQEAAQA